MTSQIFSIIAFLISFVWWLPWLIGFITFIMMQIIWCCRMKSGGLITLGILNCLCGLLSVGAAIYIFKEWRYDTWCNVWRLRLRDYEYPTYYDDNDDIYNYGYRGYVSCNYRAWAIVELIGAVFWFVAAFGPLYYVASGKLRKYQTILQEKADEEAGGIAVPTVNAIEMGAVPQQQQHHPLATATPTTGAAPSSAVAIAPARIITEIDPITQNATGGKLVTAMPTA